ncbi:hypothetical protein [Mycolicibacterium insubricum]|uniref:hypothetical protein n=1 Tax=Mycolicibacterium insubricum TaxID=444597 RepID=UPI0021F36B99|nr:hypothetical protein [Mycolicibacterium insubricum]
MYDEARTSAQPIPVGVEHMKFGDVFGVEPEDGRRGGKTGDNWFAAKQVERTEQNAPVRAAQRVDAWKDLRQLAVTQHAPHLATGQQSVELSEAGDTVVSREQGAQLTVHGRSVAGAASRR